MNASSRPTSHLYGHSGDPVPKGPAGKRGAPPADKSVGTHHHALALGRYTRLPGLGCDERVRTVRPRPGSSRHPPGPPRDPTSAGPGSLEEVVGVARADPDPKAAAGARMVPDMFPQITKASTLTILLVLRKGPPTLRLRNYREFAPLPRPSAVRAQAPQLFVGARASSVVRRVELRLQGQKRWARILCFCWDLDANLQGGTGRLQFRTLF